MMAASHGAGFLATYSVAATRIINCSMAALKVQADVASAVDNGRFAHALSQFVQRCSRQAQLLLKVCVEFEPLGHVEVVTRVCFVQMYDDADPDVASAPPPADSLHRDQAIDDEVGFCNTAWPSSPV